MARINIEDRLYRDGRFTELCIRLGSKWAALGALAEAWSIAQDHVTPENPKGLIPLQNWQNRRACMDIITGGLGEIFAIEGEQFVYLRGAEEQFAWLVAAQIKGRKGGLAKAANALESASPARKKPSPAKPRLEPSLPSSSFSSSSSKKIKNSSSFGPGAGTAELAAQCFLAVKRFGPDEAGELRKFVGDELYERVRTTCGWQAVREMKRDSFATMNLTKSIGSAG